MYNGRPPVQVGGIDNTVGARYLSVSDCRFDSVYCGVYGGGVVELDRVRMLDSRLFAIFRGDTTRFEARDCVFHGSVPLYLVTGWSGSQFVRCSFQNDGPGDMLHIGVGRLLVSGCTFGPFSASCGNAVVVYAGSGTIIENNLFHDCVVGTSVLHVAQATCTTIVQPNFEEPIIRNNVFRDNSALGCQGGYSLELHCDGESSTHLATVEANQFSDLLSHGVYATAIYVYEGAATLLNNQFDHLLPDEGAAIYAFGVVSPETLMMRDNSFTNLEVAVEHQSAQVITDARWNWWGHNSGPFNPFSNPGGLGAEVDNNVLIEPWLTRADTNASIQERPTRTLLPLRLTVYPNPFNLTTKLKFEVEKPGVHNIQVFDLAGREVQRLYNGMLAGHTEFQFGSLGLASGIYFVRIENQFGDDATAKLLLLK